MLYKKIIKGSNIYYVGDTMSYAVVNNRLYIDGKQVIFGTYTLTLLDETTEIIEVVNGEVQYE